MFKFNILLSGHSCQSGQFISVFYFLLVTIASLIVQSKAILEPPTNARLAWSLKYTTPDVFEYHRVEELVDRLSQNIHLVVYEDDASIGTSYIWIKHPGHESVLSEDVRLVRYDYEAELCSSIKIRYWPLAALTEDLSAIGKFEDLETDFMNEDPTAIGALALFRVVYDNAKIFKGEQIYLDSDISENVVIFKADFAVDEARSFRIVCVIPARRDMKTDQDITKTTLADLQLDRYPKSIAVLTFGPGDIKGTSSSRLLKLNSGFSTRLLVSFDSIEQRSIANQLGVKSSQFWEKNPFKLPAGLGCGWFLNQQTIKVKETQFSGLMRDDIGSVERFVAYDESSQHLRIDYLGEHRMIYNMPDLTVTYIRETQKDFLVQDSILDPNESRQLDTCVSGLINDVIGSDAVKLQALEDVIGLGSRTSLMYLGHEQLDDGTNCRVYEREIGLQLVPFLIKMNSSPMPAIGRAFLVFYFVNEFEPTGKDRDPVEKPDSDSISLDSSSLWLRRIVLTSTSPTEKGVILHAQMTFNQFIWSMSAMPEQTDTEELQHPVRVFDTLECKSAYEQLKLDILLKHQTDESYSFLEDLIHTERDELEEYLMRFLVSRLRIPRSEINQLGVTHIDSSYEHDQENLIVHAKISIPTSLKYKQTLVGWFEEMPEDMRLKSGSTPAGFTDHEFILKSAYDRSEKGKKGKFYTVHCHRHKFATALDSLADVNYIGTRDKRVPRDPVCRILSVELINNNVSPISEKYSPRLIEANLHDSVFIADLNHEATGVYKASVVKTSATKGLDEHALGSVVSTVECYTTLSTLILGDNPEIIEISLGVHLTVITCHRACGLHMNCLSYSYNTKSRVCTLTNIAASSLYQVIEKKTDPDCTIYEPNSLFYYKSSGTFYLMTPAALMFNHYLISSNLESCANLCRKYEMRQVKVEDSEGESNHVVHCDSFHYMPSVSICAIYDPKSYIYSTVIGKNWNGLPAEFYRKYFSSEIWDAQHSSFAYRRTYEQYFVGKHKFSISSGGLKVPNIQLGSLKVEMLLDVQVDKLDTCLLECAMLRSGCVMVDYCSRSDLVRRRKCYLYTIVDTSKTQSDSMGKEVYPHNAVTNAEYTDVQIEYILKMTQDLLVKDENYFTDCHYYQLSPDYLVSKRAFARIKAPSELVEGVEETLHIEETTAETKLDILEESHGKGWIESLTVSAFVSNFCAIFMGLTIGTVVFIYKPKLRETGVMNTLVEIGSKGYSGMKSLIRAEGHRDPLNRSTSIVELREFEEETS